MVFHGSKWVFMVPSGFSWFSMIPWEMVEKDWKKLKKNEEKKLKRIGKS